MTLLSIGDVAKQYSLSLRTLRYYDQIGLLKPSVKSESGARFYSSDDVHTLQKITLLKSISLPLSEIKKMIHNITMKEILAAQRKELQEKLSSVQVAVEKTNTLLNVLELQGELNWEELLSFIQANENMKLQDKKKTWDDLFSNEEQELLQKTLPKMEDANAAKWINIIKRIEICIKNEVEPSSEEGQLIASDVLLLSHEMFNGDTELEEKFWNARKSEDSSQSLGLYPVDQQVLEFLEKAIIEYQSSENVYKL